MLIQITFCRVRVSVDCLAQAVRLDQEDHLDHNMANTFDIHMYDTRLRQAQVQKLVSHYVLHVHRLDRFSQLPRCLDDYNYW